MPLKQYENKYALTLLGLVFFYASVSKDAPWYAMPDYAQGHKVSVREL
jgi:hypothetical protein